MEDETRPSSLTALCLSSALLSTGFLAASDTFLTVKGTPYLAAGLVIFWAGGSGEHPGGGRLAGRWRKKRKRDVTTVSLPQVETRTSGPGVGSS